MEIGQGNLRYRWIGDWVEPLDKDRRSSGWAHNGIAVTSDGDIVTGQPTDPALLVCDRQGHVLRTIECELAEAHGVQLISENGVDYLWIADHGRKRTAGSDFQYRPDERGSQVVKMDLSGRVVARLAMPPLAVYRDGPYLPTMVTVNQSRLGGNGDVWVADGYGQNRVHRYDRQGAYVGSLDGTEGSAGAFSCPHAVFVDYRKRDPELYIADRSNRRLQVYDLDGTFKRAVAADVFAAPSDFAIVGDLLFIAELGIPRLTVLDRDDRFVAYLGEHAEVAKVDGWPNERNAEGQLRATSHLVPGKFNSPHGVAADPDGNIYVTEWLIGGRYTKLEPVV